MKQTCRGLLPLIAVAAAGCAAEPDAPSQEFDELAILKALDVERAQFEAVVASGDAAAVANAVAPGAIMVQPGSAAWRTMQSVAGGAPFAPGARITITPSETVAISPDWAYELGASVVAYPSPDGGEEITLRDTYLLLLRRTPEGWKAFREVASASPPPGGWPQEQ